LIRTPRWFRAGLPPLVALLGIAAGAHGAAPAQRPATSGTGWVLDADSAAAAAPASVQAGTPSGRYIHTAIVDAGQNRMLVFGGGSYVERNDLWELTLAGTSTWSQLVFPTQAPLRMGHTAIHDVARNRMIVFGGGDPGRRNDTWVLTLSSGSEWSQLATTGTPPPPISLHSAIYDPVRDRMIVFGGYQDGGYLNGVWALSLSGTPTWTLLQTAGTPPAPRREHSAIYDPVGDRMIVFGGTNGSYFGDVWALGLAGTPTWELISASGGPTARSGQSAIYDPVRHMMWMFAGRDGSGIRNDVWTLSLGTTPFWTSVAAAGPRRVYHTAVLDQAGDRMVVFSGYDGGLPNDTWFLALGPTPTWYPLGGAPPPTTPAPVFTAEPSLPASIYLGQTLTIMTSVRNDGPASDDGRISVGFPDLDDPGDGQRVSSTSTGDAPGFQVFAAGSVIPTVDCQNVVHANYLVAQYGDGNWLASGLESNAFSVTVEPRAAGPFTIELRSTMHVTSGSECGWINAQPSGGTPGFIDQQGWAVRRYTVNVLTGPATPSPVFVSEPVPPASIEIGQTINLSFAVRNAGTRSDDGRISISFPGLTNPADGQWVTSNSAGDTPGFVETAAGGSLSGSDCQPLAASYLVAEYVDDDWAWFNTETNTFALQVTPQVLGFFYIDVRSSMHGPGTPCEWVNGVPGGVRIWQRGSAGIRCEAVHSSGHASRLPASGFHARVRFGLDDLPGRDVRRDHGSGERGLGQRRRAHRTRIPVLHRPG
jgi:hypothetical protein